MKLKKVGASDIAELRDIGVRSYLPHYKHLWLAGGVEWYLERCFGDVALHAELRDDNIEYYIAADADENVGILKLVLHKPLPESAIDDALYLEKIYFTAEYTGKGAGKQLINFACERAGSLNREAVWLMAMDTSAKPVAAYEKHGFRVHARTRLDFELMKPEFRGMVIMKKLLSDDRI